MYMELALKHLELALQAPLLELVLLVQLIAHAHLQLALQHIIILQS